MMNIHRQAKLFILIIYSTHIDIASEQKFNDPFISGVFLRPTSFVIHMLCCSENNQNSRLLLRETNKCQTSPKRSKKCIFNACVNNGNQK